MNRLEVLEQWLKDRAEEKGLGQVPFEDLRNCLETHERLEKPSNLDERLKKIESRLAQLELNQTGRRGL